MDIQDGQDRFIGNFHIHTMFILIIKINYRINFFLFINSTHLMRHNHLLFYQHSFLNKQKNIYVA